MSSEPWAAVEEPTERTDHAFASNTPAKDRTSLRHQARVAGVTGWCGLRRLRKRRVESFLNYKQQQQ